MNIYVTGVFVDDQAKALDFYTNKLGFEVKNDIPVGEHRWLTVTGQERARWYRVAPRAQRPPSRGPIQEGTRRRRYSRDFVQGR